MECPNCGSRNLGKLKKQHFYCWECFLEIDIRADDGLKIYAIEADGELAPVEIYENGDVR